MLYNIYGRAKSGKTEKVLQVLSKMIEEKKHTFLIVPEQGAVITERMIIERLGNRSNEYIEVINFKRLCNRVFRQTGGLTQTYVDSPHKLLIMSKALLSVRELLTEYRGACVISDFSKDALSMVSEFKMYGITPALIENAAEKLNTHEDSKLYNKLTDLSLIFAQYNHLLKEEYGFVDTGDDLDRLCEVISNTHFFKGKNVVVDSFFGFTVQELNILKRIILDADSTFITYLLDNDKSDFLFERGKNAYTKLTGFANENNIPTKDVYVSFDKGFKCNSLSILEKNFANELSSKPGNNTLIEENDFGVNIVKCESPYEEASFCACVVNYLTSIKGAKYSDIAICVRNIQSYSGIIDSALSKNHIPFNFDIKLDLMTRPVIALILSAFEFYSNHSKNSVLKMIKTGLTPLSDYEADIIECYIKTWNIHGKTFFNEWTMNPDGYSPDMNEHSIEVLSVAENARIKLITPLSVFCEDIKSAPTANDISRAIIRLIDDIGFICDNMSDEDITSYNMLLSALECISDIIGQSEISPVKYAENLEMILSEYNSGKIPSYIDEVAISDIELYRSTNNKYMILLGANEGIFPAIPQSNSFFSSKERALLKNAGLELSSSDAELVLDELFLAYKVLSSPSYKLYILYSEKTTSLTPISPSSIISMCKNALSGRIAEIDASYNADIMLCLDPEQLKSEYYSTNSPEIACAIKKYLEEKGATLGETEFSQDDYLSGDVTEFLFGNTITQSPSRLDVFNMCACSYFATYTLGLRPEREAQLGAIETGNIVHKILEDLMRELSEKKLKGEDFTVEYAVSREKELLRSYIISLCGNSDENISNRFRYLYSRLAGALDSCVENMTREMLTSKFISRDFELSIGDKNADVPFVNLPIDDKSSLIIRGKIDRTDVYIKDDTAYIKIVDYKTGNKVFNLSDTVAGINLQMLLYLYSLTENAKDRYGNYKLQPAGILYTPIHRPELSTQLGELNETEAKTKIKTNGILIDDLDVLRAMESELEGKYIPVKLKKDGTFYNNSSVISMETMNKLLKTAAQVASRLAYEIKSGKVAKNPYKCNINSCAFCDYAPFCRYESGDEGTRYITTKYSDEIFEKSTGENI